MKSHYYIAVLRPDRSDNNRPKWYYFVGFNCPTPRSASHPIRQAVTVSSNLNDAYFFDEDNSYLLYVTYDSLTKTHGENASQFSISNKEMFELRLKDK